MSACVFSESAIANAVIYVCGHSVEATEGKIALCRAYAALKNYSVSNEFIDDKDDCYRPGLTQMFRYLSSRRCVVIADQLPSAVGHGSEMHHLLSRGRSRLEIVTLTSSDSAWLQSKNWRDSAYIDVEVYSFDKTFLVPQFGIVGRA